MTNPGYLFLLADEACMVQSSYKPSIDERFRVRKCQVNFVLNLLLLNAVACLLWLVLLAKPSSTAAKAGKVRVVYTHVLPDSTLRRGPFARKNITTHSVIELSKWTSSRKPSSRYDSSRPSLFSVRV
jgi:hypothetical protein